MAELSVFVIERSADGLRVSVSVAVLLPGVGSVVPVGAAMVAVFAKVPVAEALTVAVSVYVAVAPSGRLMVSLMFPVPDAAQVAPAVATQVHAAAVSDAGSVSVMVAPTTFDGPAFVATMVYVTAVPGVSVAEESDLLIVRSAVAPRLSVSVAVLLPGVGSVTPPGIEMEAVFASEPVAPAATVAVSV